MEYQWFFAELAPRLKMSSVLERERDRELAYRFNVFDYLRDDELGLSHIIADLLNPEASHGQGTLFLQTLLSLERLKNTRHCPDLDRSLISVDVERVITAYRRIDISVQIVGADGETYCLAIENKPYTGDQENQVKDYLEYLGKEYRERFLLIYISPTGEGPSEWSIHKTELDEWKGRFAIMPYRGGQKEQADEFDAFRIPHSLADWLGECRKNCEVDRLRWFLRDAEIFFQRRFGCQTMITSSERKATFDFVLSNPSNLKTALAVVESWPDVKAHVSEKFLKGLSSRIETAVREQLKDFVGDMRVNYTSGNKEYRSTVWLYRECWAQYPETGEQKTYPYMRTRRTSILMQNQAEGPNNWIIGVSSPMSRTAMVDEYAKRRQRLETELERVLTGSESAERTAKLTPYCPWYVKVDRGKENWDVLVPNLHQEYEDNEGEITSYFVDKFTDIALKAIPIINDIEG